MDNKNKKMSGLVNVMDLFIAAAEKFTDLLGVIAAYLMIPLVIVFAIEIVARNIFNSPTVWAYATSFIIGGIAAVLGFAYAMKQGAMVRIDILHSRLSEKAQCILDLVLYCILFLPLMIGTSSVCITKAIDATRAMEIVSSGSWNAPIWPSKIALAVGMVALTLQGIAEMMKLIKKFMGEGKEDAE